MIWILNFDLAVELPLNCRWIAVERTKFYKLPRRTEQDVSLFGKMSIYKTGRRY